MVELLVALGLMLAPVNPSLSDDLMEMSEKIVVMEAEAALLAEAEKEPLLTGDALAVADCESGDWLADGSAVDNSWVIDAQNPVSSASGAFQFIDSTWEWVTGLPAPAKAYDLETQLDAFNKLWDNRNGMSHWAPSKSCWERKL